MIAPQAELAEFVMSYLSRGNPADPAVGAIVSGLANISTAVNDAQECLGNWGSMLTNLRNGADKVRFALEALRDAGPGFTGLIAFAERQVSFAAVMVDEIVRLQANESTPV